MTVSGTIRQGGKKVKITILPDGTTEESEVKDSGRGSYSSVYQSDGRSTSISINGDPREFIIDQLTASLPLPEVLLPVISTVVMTLLHPLLLCGACCYCCCFQTGKVRT